MSKACKITDSKIKIGSDVYTVTGTIYISYESNYGADADNRRGISVTWVDDAIITDTLKNDKPHELTFDEYNKILDNIEGNLERLL